MTSSNSGMSAPRHTGIMASSVILQMSGLTLILLRLHVVRLQVFPQPAEKLRPEMPCREIAKVRLYLLLGVAKLVLRCAFGGERGG